MSYKYSCAVCGLPKPTHQLRRIGAEELRVCRECYTPKKRNKYNAEPQEYLGHRYASKLEVAYAKYLERMREAGGINSWHPHPAGLPLVVNGVKIGRYTPDFEVYDFDGTSRFVDTKGQITSDWKFREKVIRACHPAIDLRIVRSGDFS